MEFSILDIFICKRLLISLVIKLSLLIKRIIHIIIIRKKVLSFLSIACSTQGPGCCGSVSQALSCKPKGHWFNSCSGLWIQSVVKVLRKTTNSCSLSHQCFSPSLSPSPFLLKKVAHRKQRSVSSVQPVAYGPHAAQDGRE